MAELDLREVIVLDNNSMFYIASRLSHSKNFYVMLIGSDGKEIIIQKEINVQGEIKYFKIDNKLELKEILIKFAKQRLY